MSYLTTYTFTVPKDKDRLRLDKFLSESLNSISRSRLKDLIEDDHVISDGVIVDDPSSKVRVGEIYILKVPDPIPAIPIAQKIVLNIVFEDDDLIVINKSAGMVVHPAAGHIDGTLVNALLGHCGSSLSGIGGVTRPGIVHRLDKGTSGLMIVAKNDISHRHLSQQLENRSLSRRYKALVWDALSPRQGSIEGAIGRNPANRKKMAVVNKGGKPALTHYRTIKLIGTRASLVDCRLSTGRTHQIRVHMSQMGNAIVGDPLYGGGFSRRLRDAPEKPRRILKELNHQLLHAYFIGFIHPKSRKKMCFRSDIPKEFNDLIEVFEEF
ncbi:MAG: RluA family pseudouridine synthase [Pseudomonadota bacterium]|nr:RluA family pseudouridine synthase [Pseudomonadota bacterium]